MFKFRTIKPEFNGLTPEEAFTKMDRPELIKRYRDGGDTIPNDPRFTKLGKILRVTSLDELPQLLNIIKGDISLVGPRPLIPQELSAYEKKHTILSVKSGLTGLAVVSGRRDIPYDERRKLDIYYVQNWSFWLDLTILVKTVRVILERTGAK
jgi:undecaprenyl-phosphate galactose phosphotransferase